MSRLGRAIGVAVLVAVVGMVLRFPGALPGPKVVSAHDHLSVHPLFQNGNDRGHVTHPHLSDPALQFAALDTRTVAALRRWEAPLWNPDIYLGAPLLGDAQSRPMSPVTLLRVPSWSASFAQDLGVAWLLLWSALGWGLLGGRLLRSDDETRRIAVAVGAAVGLTSPFLSVWLLHPHASTVVWLPWGLLALEAESAWALALATAGLLTGGHPGTMVHVGGLWAGWWTVRSRRPALLLGAVAGGLLAAPLWVPVLEQAGRSTTFAARVGSTLLPRQLVDLMWPSALGHPVVDTWKGPGAWADGQLHPGLGAMVLAVGGALKRKVGVEHVAWGLVFLCGLASVVGLPGPIAHGRLLGLSVALLAIPAAAAVALLPGGRWRWIVPAGVLLTGTHARWNDQHTVPSDVHEVKVAAWADGLVEAAAGGRALGLDWALQPNTGALAGLRDVRGYDLPVSVDTHRLMTALNQAPRGPWYPLYTPPTELQRRWLGVNVVAGFPSSDAPIASRLPGWTPLKQPDRAPLETFVAPTPAKMAWLAGAATLLPSPDRAIHAAFSVENATHSVPVEVPVAAVGQPAGQLDAVRVERGGSAFDLRFVAQDRPMVAVVSEAWAPGWRARLSDGTAVAPLRIGGIVLGAAIPPGVDAVSFYYRPEGWIVGQRLFLGGLLLLLGMVMWRLRDHRAYRVRS